MKSIFIAYCPASFGPQVAKILKYNYEHKAVYCEMMSTLKLSISITPY